MENDKIVNNKLIIELYRCGIVNRSNYEQFAELLYKTFIDNYEDFEHIYTNILNDEYFKMHNHQKYEIAKKYSHLLKNITNKTHHCLPFYIPCVFFELIRESQIISCEEQWHNVGEKFEIQFKNYFFDVIEQPLVKSATKLK